MFHWYFLLLTLALSLRRRHTCPCANSRTYATHVFSYASLTPFQDYDYAYIASTQNLLIFNGPPTP